MNSSIPQRVKVLLADDHRIVREGIRSCLTPYQLIEVIGEASDGAEAVSKSKELNPDVVLMDITMPSMNGLEATKLLRCEAPAVCSRCIKAPSMCSALWSAALAAMC